MRRWRPSFLLTYLRRSFFQSSRYKTSIAGAAGLILSKKAGVSNLCIAEEE